MAWPCHLPAPPPRLFVVQFVLTTAPGIRNLVEQLQHIYANIFVERVVKNPLYTPGEPFL